MVKLSGVQHATSSHVIQGARAYQAARAGVSWSIAKISSVSDCTNFASASSLSFSGINGFSVILACDFTGNYMEGGNSYNVYKVTATSKYNIYANANYISRKIEVSFIK